jgi:lysyl-tRNA synthetase class 2
MEHNELEKIRVDKIHRMQQAGINPYPLRANPTHTTQAARQVFEQAETATPPAEVQVTLAGRLRSTRTMGKIIFAHIEDGSGRIQLFLRHNDLGDEGMKNFADYFDLGDFIEARGVMFRTRTGEISLHVKQFHMLAKAVTPLPAAKDEVVNGEIVRHATLTDPEVRYRQRYADLAVNEDVRQVFRTRAAIVRSLREFLDQRDFMEVETPV